MVKRIKKNFFNSRIVKIVLIFIIIINMFVPKCFADDENEEDFEDTFENEIQSEELESIETSAKENKEPAVNARSAIIYDRETKRVLWQKNINDKRAMASTTKIMTAIVVLENVSLNDIVEISKKAAGTGGSRLKINAGDKITVNDLLYGLMLRSRK